VAVGCIGEWIVSIIGGMVGIMLVGTIAFVESIGFCVVSWRSQLLVLIHSQLHPVVCPVEVCAVCCWVGPQG
jgi:hypothetical protein